MLKIALNLYIPLIITNFLHMIVVKKNLFSFLKIPINNKLFGKNKTYRGLFFMGISTSIVYGIYWVLVQGRFEIQFFLIGLTLGLTYIFFELPNSFLKRMMGIGPGQKPTTNKLFYTLLDKMDSTFGVSFVYSLIYNLDLVAFAILFFTAFVIHISLSNLLVILKVKESL